MITHSQARSMAEANWGRGGTKSRRTNRTGAFYFSCSSHGGYIIDGRAMSEEARKAISAYREPETTSEVIDPETGVVTLERYTAVDDYGTMINPLLVEGQVHGAIAQGLGQALMEHAVYDRGSGQLISGSFMDYCMPRADNLPSFDIFLEGVPCTTNPLGVKGSGEAGAIAGLPAAVNAVLDALGSIGVQTLNGPATPETVWRLISGQGGAT